MPGHTEKPYGLNFCFLKIVEIETFSGVTAITQQDLFQDMKYSIKIGQKRQIGGRGVKLLTPRP
jgi:hypothetical protein